MKNYSEYADDYYVNMQLNTEMNLPSNRETIMFFFEQLQKRFPAMQHFYQRERNEFVLEEDKESGSYRWATVEPRRIYSAFVNPPTVADSMEQCCFILDSIPHTLSTSPLDCESLSFVFGFDFSYRGNHNELVREALGGHPAFESLSDIAGYQLIGYEPAVVFSLDPECRTRCRVSVETRTTPQHIRTGEYLEEQLSVFAIVRHAGSLGPKETYTEVFQRLYRHGQEIVDNYVVDNLLVPLQHCIRTK